MFSRDVQSLRHPHATLHGVVFDIFDGSGHQAPTGGRSQRNGFFSSEKRSGSRPSEGCSIGASTLTVRAAGRSLMVGSLGTSRCEVAPRQRSSTALTKCMSWPAAADGTVEIVASLRGN